MPPALSLLITLSNQDREPWARAIAAFCGSASPTILIASPSETAKEIERQQLSPTHIVLDIGDRGLNVLDEIDVLAQQCNAGTRVLVTGNTNDIVLYRGLLARGVIDYLPMPCDPNDVARALMAPPAMAAAQAPVANKTSASSLSPKRVIAFCASGSGDGASMASLNTAYALSQLFNGSTVLIDMDYQYGLVAKQLNLQSQYGIRELFDFPERGIDTTLIKRMVASYGKLDVITAPTELRYLPNVSAEAIADLIATLKLSYDNIVIDLPHLWLPWIATILQHSTHIVLVSQLWLKSVSHAARMMRMLRELNIPIERVISVINRSGAKFKEAIEQKDFERVCGIHVRYTLGNDIRTITTAEAAAKTVLEMDDSPLAADIMAMARGIADLPAHGGKESAKTGLLSGLLKRS
jgi:pilus assembly protein CpaE